jgi:hypothetical protein
MPDFGISWMNDYAPAGSAPPEMAHVIAAARRRVKRE